MMLHSNKVPKDKQKLSHNSLTKVSHKFLTIVAIAFHRLRKALSAEFKHFKIRAKTATFFCLWLIFVWTELFCWNDH